MASTDKDQPEEKYQIRPSYKNSSDGTPITCPAMAWTELLRVARLAADALSALPALAAPLLLFCSLNPRVVKDLINSVLVDHLKGKEYDQNETGAWTKEIATAIKAKLKDLKLPRYKFLVQVIIGEMKGAGVRCGCRCLWDQQTDKVAEATFQNDSLFCVAVAFGVYLY